MNEQQEAILHALTLEPRVARPGSTVRLCFRTPNLGAGASPPGNVRFTLPPELEPQEAVLQLVGPVPPGADVVATLSARVAGPLEDGTRLTVWAALELETRTLATNRCTILVRSRPQLDGQASGVFVTSKDEQTVGVRAVVCNEGDGPACDLHVVVPPPLGCVRSDGDGPAVLTLARLDVGERAEVEFEAKIVAPIREIVADDAFVRFADGGQIALPARDRIELQPSLATPVASIAIAGRRAEIAIAVHNDGWVDAHDVALRITLPPPLRPLEGSIATDGVAALRRPRAPAVARFERNAAVTTVVLAHVAARASAHVTLATAMPAGFAGAPLRLQLDAHDVTVPLHVESVRSVRLSIVDGPRTVEAGASVTLVAHVANGGDVAEEIVLSAQGDALASAGEPACRTLAPGTVAKIPLALRLVSDLPDDARPSVAIVAADASGERARTELELIVRDRAWIELLEPPLRTDGGVAYCLRNAGTTTARDVSAQIGGTTYLLGEITPGASVRVVAREHEARRGGSVFAGGREALGLPALEEAVAPEVRIALEAPAHVLAGAPFVVRARVVIDGAADRVVLRAPALEGGAYVPGSTVLDGIALLDPARNSPLAEGLVLRGIQGETELRVAWSILADPEIAEGALEVWMTALVDGEEILAEPATVAVSGRDAFAARPAGLGYHVEACVRSVEVEPQRSAEAQEIDAIPPALDALPFFEPSPVPDRGEQFFFSLPVDERRLEEIARLIRGNDGGSLAAHLLPLRALFPVSESSGDLLVGGALLDVSDALRDLFDRLFVKLRIPGFDVGASDLEDSLLRRSLVTLFERLAEATPGEETFGAASARIDRDRVRELLLSFADAPYGAPQMLRALLALVPTACEDEPLLEAALARYVAALDRALSRCEDLAPDAYDAALAAGRQDDLDDARIALLAALRGRVLAGAA